MTASYEPTTSEVPRDVHMYEVDEMRLLHHPAHYTLAKKQCGKAAASNSGATIIIFTALQIYPQALLPSLYRHSLSHSPTSIPPSSTSIP